MNRPIRGARGAGRMCLAALAVATALFAAGCGSSDSDESTGAANSASGSTIPVGILHSLSGTMAISEVSVRDAELLAIEEINTAGGVLG